MDDLFDPSTDFYIGNDTSTPTASAVTPDSSGSSFLSGITSFLSGAAPLATAVGNVISSNKKTTAPAQNPLLATAGSYTVLIFGAIGLAIVVVLVFVFRGRGK